MRCDLRDLRACLAVAVVPALVVGGAAVAVGVDPVLALRTATAGAAIVLLSAPLPHLLRGFGPRGLLGGTLLAMILRLVAATICLVAIAETGEYGVASATVMLASILAIAVLGDAVVLARFLEHDGEPSRG